jgi:hypothetical protein
VLLEVAGTETGVYSNATGTLDTTTASGEGQRRSFHCITSEAKNRGTLREDSDWIRDFESLFSCFSYFAFEIRGCLGFGIWGAVWEHSSAF